MTLGATGLGWREGRMTIFLTYEELEADAEGVIDRCQREGEIGIMRDGQLIVKLLPLDAGEDENS